MGTHRPQVGPGPIDHPKVRLVKYLHLLLMLALGSVRALPGQSAEARQRQDGCLIARTHSDSLHDDSFVRTIRTNILGHRTNLWRHLDFADADVASIRIITDARTCNLAMSTLRAFFTDSAFVPSEILLAHAGKYFIAEGGSNGPRNEFRYIYIFDDPIVHVLFPCANGYACKQ